MIARTQPLPLPPVVSLDPEDLSSRVLDEDKELDEGKVLEEHGLEPRKRGTSKRSRDAWCVVPTDKHGPLVNANYSLESSLNFGRVRDATQAKKPPRSSVSFQSTSSSKTTSPEELQHEGPIGKPTIRYHTGELPNKWCFINVKESVRPCQTFHNSLCWRECAGYLAFGAKPY